MDQAMAGRKTGFSNRGLVILNMILVVSQISSYATGYDGSMMSELTLINSCVEIWLTPIDGLQSLDTWKAYFNNPSANTLGILNAIQNIGQLVALPFCAYACDKFGRVAILAFGAFIILIGTILQGAAQSSK